MSKDKGGREVKKAASETKTKGPSDYQSGKKSASTTDAGAGKKK